MPSEKIWNRRGSLSEHRLGSQREVLASIETAGADNSSIESYLSTL